MNEGKPTFKEAWIDFKAAVCDSWPLKQFLAWITPSKLLFISIIMSIVLFGILYIGFAEVEGWWLFNN